MASKQKQTFGTPGWLLLTPGPSVHWVTNDNEREEVSMVIDERICCSTLLRAERISPTVFAVADMLYLNGRYVWETHNFEQRLRWIHQLLDELHTRELSKLVKKDDLDVPIRGWEYYTSSPGMIGSYIPLPSMAPMKWTPTEDPDIWKNTSGKLLRLRTIDEINRLRKNPIVPSRILDGRVEILV